MRYFTRDSDNEITLSGQRQHPDAARVLSIERVDGLIRFREECDAYFFEDYTKEQAVELLQEAISWVLET